MAKLLTQKWPKNGQVINSTAYIYIHTYIHTYKRRGNNSFGVCILFMLGEGAGFVYFCCCHLMSGCCLKQDCRSQWEAKNNKHKIHKQFSDGPCGTIVPGTDPHLSQGQPGQNALLWNHLNGRFVPRTGPGLFRDGPRLS